MQWVALVCAVLLASAGALAVPAGAAVTGAAVPSAPIPIVSVGYKGSIRLYWTRPTSNGSAVTSYRVDRAFLATETPDRTFTRPTTAVLVDSSAEDAVSYRYRIRATNAAGDGPWSAWIAATKVTDRTDYLKFKDRAAFATRQYDDLLGRPATSGELAGATAGLTDGTITPAQLIDALVHEPLRQLLREPVIRLYATYFRRAPDHGGLAYWSAQRKAGRKTLDDVSSLFASSSEFRHTYGSLSDADFVKLVYRNVLGRTPDSTGGAFWRRQLAIRASTRGRMMTKFSESNEFVLLSAGVVLAADVHDAMLGTAISATDRIRWGSHIQGGGTAGGYGTYLLTLDSYRSSR